MNLKASGIDKLSAKFLKHGASIISEPIADLCMNHCISGRNSTYAKHQSLKKHGSSVNIDSPGECPYVSLY